MKPTNDHRMHPHEIPPPTHNGHAMAETDNSDELEFIIRLGARYSLTVEQAQQIASDAQEHYGGTEKPHAEFWRVRGMIERGFLVLRSYAQKGGDRDMAERCLWLLLGFPTLAGAESLAGIVKFTGKQKATVNKCCQFLQKQMPELPILEGQRDAKARANMVKARVGQIKH